MKALLLLLLPFSVLAVENKCLSERGIRLDDIGKPYYNSPIKDQGKLGNCFAYSSTELVKTFLGLNVEINVFEAALRAGSDVNGGQPYGVISALGKAHTICTNLDSYKNMFPSQDTNLVSELKDVIREYPYFSGPMKEEAKKILNGDTKGTHIINDMSSGLNDYNSSLFQINSLEERIKQLEKSKSIFNRNSTNEAIQVEIDKLKISLVQLRIKRDASHERYLKGSEVVNLMKYRLEKLSATEAGEVIAYWTKALYPSVITLFKKYSVPENTIPTMMEFLENRSNMAFAGTTYANFLALLAGTKNCQGKFVQSIPEFKAESYEEDQHHLFEGKIDSLLSKSSPQGVGLNINSDAISKDEYRTGGNHAVQIIGCRQLNGQKQYLIKNSWGGRCGMYPDSASCKDGKVWFGADKLLLYATEITWIRK